MWVELAVLGIAILAIFTLSYLFLVPIISVAVNGFLLYLIFLRARTDILKRNRGEIYAWSAAAGFFITVLLYKIIPLWMITTWAVITIALVYLYLRVIK